jgi:nicotinamide mononucleotide adenylyltransferase
MIKRFLSFILESEEKHAVLLFGRMNPPTSGHEDNIAAAQKHAKKIGADFHFVASRSSGSKTKSGPNKDPLTPEQKQKHLQRAFPNTNVSVADAEHPSIFHQVKRLHKMGYSHITIAGGGDRASEYERIKQYHGPEGKDEEHRFKSVNVFNTGEREAGISGTDMREHAKSGNYDKFKKNLPSNIQKNEKHSKELYDDVRKGLGVK